MLNVVFAQMVLSYKCKSHKHKRFPQVWSLHFIFQPAISKCNVFFNFIFSFCELFKVNNVPS